MTQAAARSAGTFGGTFDSPDPATGAVVASFPMGPDEVRAVVARARIVGHWWASQPHAVRRAALLAWAAYLVRHSGVLVGLVSREQGKSRDEAYLELVPALEQIRWAARHAAGVLRRRRVLPNLPMANHLAEVEYQPYGVVGVIGPWNYPLFTPAGMIGYALAAGNAVVLKPSEHTTAVGEYLVLAFALANPGLPDGLLGLVTGMGPTGGALIDSGVDKVAFTGSPATGRQVMAACARSLTPLVLECGGKDPMIVADDADLAAAAKAAIWGGMANSGQTCVGIERVYVVASVRDRFLAELQRQLGGVRAGPGPGSAYGPMSTPQQFEIVRRQVDEALDAGAIPLVGGRTSMDRPFIGPVVLVDPPDTCSVMTEETFGPVLAVRTVADTDEAVRLANDGRYGLGASVFSRHHGKDIARRIASGMVAVNCGLAFVGIPGLPFGGQGESGFGRIHGAEGLREFARPRSYTEQKFAVPGMDVATLRPREATMRAVRLLMTVRHGQIARRAVNRGQFAREKGR